MSRVMPKPAAAFSALAITKSMSSPHQHGAKALAQKLSTRAADDVADEEQLHAGPGPGVVTAIRWPWPRRSMTFRQVHHSSPLLSDARAAEMSKAPVSRHGPGEAPELPLDEMERVLAGLGSRAFSPTMTSTPARTKTRSAAAGTPHTSTTTSSASSVSRTSIEGCHWPDGARCSRGSVAASSSKSCLTSSFKALGSGCGVRTSRATKG